MLPKEKKMWMAGLPTMHITNAFPISLFPKIASLVLHPLSYTGAHGQKISLQLEEEY